MTNGNIPAGGIPLGGQQVNIHDMRLLSVASVDFLDGGLSIGLCTLHVRVVDVPHGQAWLIPITRAHVERIVQQLEGLL
jgi:hypothetical protein